MASSPETTNVYVLQCTEGRWYVGKSKNVYSRIEQHLNGTGSIWTQTYKPISLHKIYRNVSSFQEDSITREYMDTYGIDFVRGGAYTSITLPFATRFQLQREIWSAKDCCLTCGSEGHFAKDCDSEFRGCSLNVSHFPATILSLSLSVSERRIRADIIREKFLDLFYIVGANSKLNLNLEQKSHAIINLWTYICSKEALPFFKCMCSRFSSFRTFLLDRCVRVMEQNNGEIPKLDELCNTVIQNLDLYGTGLIKLQLYYTPNEGFICKSL